MNKKKEVKRSGFLMVQVSDAEKEAIRKLADSKGLNMSALTRMVFLDLIKSEEKNND